MNKEPQSDATLTGYGHCRVTSPLPRTRTARSIPRGLFSAVQRHVAKRNSLNALAGPGTAVQGSESASPKTERSPFAKNSCVSQRQYRHSGEALFFQSMMIGFSKRAIRIQRRTTQPPQRTSLHTAEFGGLHSRRRWWFGPWLNHSSIGLQKRAFYHPVMSGNSQVFSLLRSVLQADRSL